MYVSFLYVLFLLPGSLNWSMATEPSGQQPILSTMSSGPSKVHAHHTRKLRQTFSCSWSSSCSDSLTLAECQYGTFFVNVTGQPPAEIESESTPVLPEDFVVPILELQPPTNSAVWTPRCWPTSPTLVAARFKSTVVRVASAGPAAVSCCLGHHHCQHRPGRRLPQ